MACQDIVKSGNEKKKQDVDLKFTKVQSYSKTLQHNGSSAAEVLLMPEITLKIFSYLRTKDICRLARVCKVWRNIARDQELITNIDLENCSQCQDIHFIGLLKNIGTANLPKVSSVNIAGTSIKGEILPLLTLWCPEIQQLKLSGTQMNRKMLVRSAKHLKHLQSLSIRDCDDMDHELAKQLVELLPQLLHLYLPGSKNFDDKALSEVAVGFPELRALDISRCPKVTDVGLGQVVKINRKLESLDVSGCPVLSYLTAVSVTKNCHKLRKIRAINTGLTDSGFNVFLRRPPNKELKSFSIIANPTEDMEVVVGIFRVSIP